MSNHADIASNVQSQASDPATSAWVSANAGAGKTHVLVNRVVRLMLSGTPPERILCLTYTRAAAAEMARRLYDELAGWIALDDEALIERIHKTTGHASFKKTEHAVARRLFATALETPGGLKVQTIHAFCERLLQRFPVEAGIVPGFEVMDEATARELLAGARAQVFAMAGEEEDAGRTAQHLAAIAGFTSADRFDGLLKELLAKRSELAPLMSSAAALEAGLGELEDILGLEPGDTSELVVHHAVADIDKAAYQAAADVLSARSSTRDKAQAELIRQLLGAQNDDDKFAMLQRLFLNSDGERKNDTFVLTKAAGIEVPLIRDQLLVQCDRFVAAMERWRACRIHQATGALLHLGRQIIDAYEAEKRRQGLCDYDDLILRTQALLAEKHASLWVLYKLDGGLDHVLIDEAQDTSPQQWTIIAKLTEEFFSGEGARPGAGRTVFAVGDYKQSIYSFQGADPSAFATMRKYFRTRIAGAGGALAEIPLQVSFRSTPQVLSVVDQVFAQPLAAIGLEGLHDGATDHAAKRSGDAGLVELWPLVVRDDAAAGELWSAPQSIDAGRHPRLQLARQIAATIRSWINDERELTPRGRAIRYGDILILVRTRTTFMDGLVRALKLAGIPVAGADRLVLTKHIAVQDLMALARFVLLPSDDLTLASVLKGPLVERDDGAPFDDDDLFKLAHERAKQTLWQRLKAAADAGSPYKDAYSLLSGWRARAGFETPYQFFSQVLIGAGKRRAMLRRLGTEAGDPIDAFVDAALNYQASHTASLHGFLGWLEGADLQIKRDMDHSTNEVRVMTVHGAKGLEANIVILPDTTGVPGGRTDPNVLFAPDSDTGLLPVWRLRARDHIAATDRLKQRYGRRALQEHNRLLYVAMTRARDQLYICGYNNTDEVKPQSWYGLVSEVLARAEYEVPGADQAAPVWRIEGRQTDAASEAGEQGEPLVRPALLPAWATAKPTREAESLRWFVPSRLAADRTDTSRDVAERFESPLSGKRADLFKRGNVIHKLLQILPDLEPQRRAAAGRRFLGRKSLGLEKTEAAGILDEVLALFDDASFAAVFGPGSLAEVPLAARLDLGSGAIGLTGQIDRLVVGDDAVLIVDYKTNRPAPDRLENIDAAYIRQLAAYRAALVQLYPAKPVRTALLWTNTARLMEVPEAMLLAAF